MTRRERLEAKIEKRRDWAEGRQAKAAGLLKRNEPYRGDTAFNTQPGHIPERARVIARSEKAFEHTTMAEHHEAKAGGLERQLDRSIFTDDPDAIEALEARIAEREAMQARMKATNQAIKKAQKADPSKDPAQILAGLVEANIITGPAASRLARNFALMSYHGLGYAGYELINNSACIRKDKKQIEEVKRRRQAQAEAEAAPGGVIITGGADYVNVRFAEKPDREILEALRAAEFHWSGGAWCGYRSKIPAGVLDLISEATPAAPAQVEA